jgi:HIRAN domain
MGIVQQMRGGGGATIAPEEPQPIMVQPSGTFTEAAIALARPGGNGEPASAGSVYFCHVKGATRRNGGDPTGAPGLKLYAIGDRVQLVPDPQNKIDPDALLVRRMTGEPIGFITGRQAARFVDKLHLVSATVHSWEKDDWNHDVLNLRVEELPEPPAAELPPPEEDVTLTKSQSLIRAAIDLPLSKVLLGSLLITCTGVAIVTHSWKPAAIALGAVVLVAILRSAKS